MNRPLHTPRAKLVIAVAAVAVLSGCASVNLEQNLTSANTAASGFTDGQLTLARDQSERDALRQRAQDKGSVRDRLVAWGAHAAPQRAAAFRGQSC